MQVRVFIFDKCGQSLPACIAGGTGALGRELAATHPQMDVVVADLIHVLPITRHFMTKSTHLSNLSIKACEFCPAGQFLCFLVAAPRCTSFPAAEILPCSLRSKEKHHSIDI